MLKGSKIATVCWAFAAATVANAHMNADVQSRMGIPAVHHIEVISSERNNATIQCFLDTFMPDRATRWECRTGETKLERNVEALQGCLRDPYAKNCYWWFSRKLRPEFMETDDAKTDAPPDFSGGEILAKSVQFLEDGHVIFCLYTYEEFGDVEWINEKKVLGRLKECVKSQLGYIGGQGSPEVHSLAEFMVQMEEHEKHGHWMLRKGTFNGEVMVAGQFLQKAYAEATELDEEEVAGDGGPFIGHTSTGIVMRVRGREYHFLFDEVTKMEDKNHRYFSSSLDTDGK